MLTYFFIIWIVLFFALCSPLLFITDKEKKAYRYQSWKTPKDERNFNLDNEKSAIDNKLNSVVGSTGLLNAIFLLILPYIICATLDFSFFQIFFTYIIIIIGIIGLFIILISGFGNSKMFGFLPRLSILFFSLPFLPGYLLTKLVLR